ncbi:TldD/PmbA family protein [Natranaerobius thermophilus]|uniref:Peptidase U62 modulator of DNA gyrase n=1 Tax=Natranaerobius thermophilus (strain ATCC BAA-1301 / DSM 18059 / JW/NM-WN-LF) TaxID=457570 RepID=B2A5P4_NATTJ|nr:TldD/PmbA family protein [Natranaerobius thermophilus]ACB83992.1 peptidase U62 modulator of DNA gyrase [Natranaerobius thermophilus JW/NM-WN-LF]
MDKLLSLAKKKNEQAELFEVSVTRTPVEFENNKLKNIKTKEQKSTALRLISPDNRLGFCTTTSTEDKAEDLLNKARETSQFGRSFQPSLPKVNPEELDNMYDQDVMDLPTEKMIEMGEEIVDSIRSKNSEALASASIEKTQLQVKIKNSEGLNTEYERTAFSVRGGAMLLVGKSFLRIGQGKKLPRLFTDLTALKNELMQDLHYGSKEKEINSGSYKVIFAPEAMSDFMRPILASLNGQSVEKEVSPFKDKLDQQLFDEKVNLTDMPHRPFSPGMCPVDDEGVPTKETDLIKNGTIKTFPVDLLTAHSLGVEPTGHGIRQSPYSLPAPDLHTCVLSPGEMAYHDMIGELDRGIIIKDLMGAWAGNPYSGEVNGNISLGYLVENGKIIGRIKDCMVAVNVFEALQNQLVSFSQEAKWIGNRLFPYALLEGIDITAKN